MTSHTVIVNSSDLDQALRGMTKTCPRKPTLPVLSLVYLDCNGKVDLYTTDLDRFTHSDLDRIVPGDDWSVTVPYRHFRDLARTYGKDQPVYIELDQETQYITVKCENSTAVLKGFFAHDFPIAGIKAGNIKDIANHPPHRKRRVRFNIEMDGDLYPYRGWSTPTEGIIACRPPVYSEVSDDLLDEMNRGWQLIHQVSGKMIDFGKDYTLKDAFHVAEKLGDLTDWTQYPDVIKESVNKEEFDKIITEV